MGGLQTLENEDASDSLSFTTKSPRNWWNPDTSGDWDEQNERGKKYAQELCAYIAASGDMAVLSAVMGAMHAPAARVMCGVAAGFLAWISYQLSKAVVTRAFFTPAR